ncbi:MAG: thiol oxidoreductase [Betaproteobacteria bacterium]|nr:thiol oxidoreductase [Betaproteobacteria bacterium]
MKKAVLVLASLLWFVHGTAITQTPTDKPVVPQEVYKQPVAGLSPKQMQVFLKGERVFTNFWMAVNNPVIPLVWDLSQPGPAGGEWGLGPMFLATNCASCHLNAGRGRALDASGSLAIQHVLRISIPGDGPHGSPKPDPNYGTEIQMFDTITRKDPEARAGEGEVFIDWLAKVFTFPDGETLELRQPKVRVEKLNFGPLSEGVMMSLRNSQAMVGMGYLEAIAEKDILQVAQQQKAQGLNGRPNYVRDDINNKQAMGRFGWKANQPSIRQQIASAFSADIGITSSLYPFQNCTPVQHECLAAIKGPKPELRPELWDSITFWTQALEVPERRDTDKPEVKRGDALFVSSGCAMCHVPEWRTGKYTAVQPISNKRINPYTDLLLHDMGPDLADGRPDFKASGSDWRTPPLWGIGLSKQVSASTSFLHDGRARNLLEAIVWHGGEAKASRDKFTALPAEQRKDVITFLESL